MFKATLEFNLYYYELKRLAMDKALRRIGFQKGRVLDVGSGVGFWVGYFLGRGSKVVGLDVVPEMVNLLRSRFPKAKFYVADITQWVPPGEFDLVNAFDVLFHIVHGDAWRRALLNIWRALKPGGFLLLTDVWGLGEGTFSDSEHVLFRGSAHYLRALPQADVLAVVPIYYIFGAPLSLKGLEAALVARAFKYVRRLAKKPSLARSLIPPLFQVEKLLLRFSKPSSTCLVALRKPQNDL